MHSPTTSHFFPTDNKVIETYRSLSNCPRFFRRSKVRQILPRSASLHRLPTDYGSTRHRKNHVDSSVKVCYKRKKKRKDPTEITWTSSFGWVIMKCARIPWWVARRPYMVSYAMRDISSASTEKKGSWTTYYFSTSSVDKQSITCGQLAQSKPVKKKDDLEPPLKLEQLMASTCCS